MARTRIKISLLAYALLLNMSYFTVYSQVGFKTVYIPEEDFETIEEVNGE